MIRAGVIGFGLAGKSFHAPLIAAVEGLELAGVATSRAAEVEQAFPGCRVYRSADELIADGAIDLVVIATPNDSHAPLARAAIDAGKHVVIDKPFVTDPVDGTALIGRARERGAVLSVFHNRRWDGDFLTVRKIIDSAELGCLRLAEMHWDRLRPAIKPGWREEPGEGAGLLADLGPHLVDQALRLFGPPDAVAADVLSQRGEAMVDDYFALTLHYGALRVLLSASTLVAAPRPRFGLHGTGGSFVKYGIDPQEAALRAGGGANCADYGEEPATAYGLLTRADGTTERVPTERGDWRPFYEGILGAIENGAAPPVDPADALTGLRIIALARQSAAEGRMLRFAR